MADVQLLGAGAWRGKALAPDWILLLRLTGPFRYPSSRLDS